MRRSIAGVALGLLLASSTAAAQTFSTDDSVLHRIWAVGMDSSRTYQLSQALFDSIGPRLTGSPGFKSAGDWALAMYQSWGIAARAEPYGTWKGWRRGVTHIDLVAPRVRTLAGTMLSFSPGTGGKTVRADVLLLPDVADSAAFRAWLPQVKGKFVAVSYPEPTCRTDSEWITTALPDTWKRLQDGRTAERSAWAARIRNAAGNQRLLEIALDGAGAAGILQSTWSGGWGTHRVFNASTEHAPVIDLECEDYGLVARLAQNHDGPVVQLAADAQFLGDVPVFNTVAEIRGSELPNEYVMLSAHFDSWDGGSGATDNGTGTITMMEAMRILKAAYPHPRRTILVGDWASEENGLDGSRAFVADHPDVVAHLQALFNQDNGTGRVINMSASGFVDASANLGRWLSRVPSELTRGITFQFPGMPAGGGTDHASFDCAGAPGFGLGSLNWDYFLYTWHTNRDTFDKIVFDELKSNAVLTAMLVYLASEDPQPVPRERRTVFPTRAGFGPGGPSGTSWPVCAPPPRNFGDYLHEVEQREAQQRQAQQQAPRGP
ncbi:MAG TPA: M20/M25/M40 family metallo-hydrolase [Gemmatimonadales bacterium]|nr:M20/M25/M40 family metallo-hydrolase [Gemmatimonadales bacterium]